jgi:anti-sigma B factor antagonist
MAFELKSRQLGDVVVLAPSGRITLGEASNHLRDKVRDLARAGHRKIVLDMAGVTYIDSSGIGELVSAYTSLRNQGGDLKLAHLGQRAHDLLQLTKLCTVFEIFDSEAAAVISYD